MSVVLPGGLIMAILLLTSVLLFGTSLRSWTAQAQSFKELADVNTQRVGSVIDITSTSVGGSGSNVTVVVKNTGSQSITSFPQMDVIMHYTASNNNLTVTYLVYTTSSLSNGQWTKTIISPDSFNPGLWDPGETLTIDLQVAPGIKAGTTGTVVVATPRGVTDSYPVVN